MIQAANAATRTLQRVSVAASTALAALSIHATPVCKIEKVDVVASGLTMPYSIAVEGNDRLVVSTMTGVMRVTKDGDTSLLFGTQQGSPSGVLKDRSSWLILENATQRLFRFDEKSNRVDVVATGLGDAVTLARDGNALWVTDYAYGSGAGRLLKLEHGVAREIRTQPPVSAPGGVAAIQGRVVYAEFDLGELRQVGRDGRASVVATGLGKPVDVLALRSGVLVADFGGFQGNNGRLLYVSRGGKVTELAGPELLNSAVGLAIVGDEVLISDMLGGRVLKAMLPEDSRCYR